MGELVYTKKWLGQSTLSIPYPLECYVRKRTICEIQVTYQTSSVTKAEVKSEEPRAFFITQVRKICAETVSSRESARDCDLMHVEDCRYVGK